MELFKKKNYRLQNQSQRNWENINGKSDIAK